MLDPDISTADALRHLSRPGSEDALSLDRRRFLQMVGMGLGAGLVAGPGTSLLDAATGHDPSAWALGPVGPNDGILVVIGMYGGNDGLNTVVPINDGLYYDQHGSLAIPGSDTLALDANSGLHPELTEFKRMWDLGQLAIVEGVGHDQEEFSHFTSMAMWMAGRPTGITNSGWLGRWLDGYLGTGRDLYAAAEIGHSIPLHMIGNRSIATTVPTSRPDFGVPRSWRSNADLALFDTVRDLAAQADPSTWRGRVGQAQIDQLDLATTLNTVIPADGDLSATEIVAKLQVAARLINANLGFRVLTAGFGDFDSHAGQPNQHESRMQELNEAIRSFYQTLAPAWGGRVTIMTFSEFGRTPFANDGQGTDHGSSAPHFVLGPAVKGGRYGQRPSLAGLQRWERMPTHVDLRDYYGSVIDGWLGGGASEIMPGNRVDLGLFRRGPSDVPVNPPTVSSTRFVAMVPERVYDSRSGTGGRTTRIRPRETVKVKIAGVGSIPATGVTAVAINVTSIRPDASSFLTVFPTGQTRPVASTLNPRAGRVVPNLAIVGVGPDGTISIYNETSTPHLNVDVMGYFQTSTGASAGALGRMLPLSPSRILDTRSGIGAPKARLQGGKILKLQVAGRGGVPNRGVDSVVINLLAVRPTASGYVTTWPSGASKPNTASLSLTEGLTAPNLVVCKLGTDGAISIEANTGTLDVVADVVGCFTSTGSQLSAVTPRRVLDTRFGTGAPKARVGAKREVSIRVAGLNGVPSSATAVALNVTAVRPSEQTFLTVYPTGEALPTASSLNPDQGNVSANLVIAKVGRDGMVSIYNERGTVEIVADLTAYFV